MVTYFQQSVSILALGGLLLLGLGSCATTSTPKTTTPSRKTVLTTFTVIADMAQNIAGDKLTVRSIVKPGAEIHGYEPTPSDLVGAKSAALVLDNGLNLERWAERFYQRLPQVPRATLSRGVTPIPIADDAYKGRPNPHAWMSPKNALVYIENIRQALTTLDPANQETYRDRARAYSDRLSTLDAKLKQAIAAIPSDRRYIVSCEGAFAYLARDYGLQEVYLWPVNAEQQATPQRIAQAIAKVKDKKIPAVFCESTVNTTAQEQVAKATGAHFGGVFYVDSLSPPTGPTPTYLKLLEHNVTTLIQGLQAGSNP